MPQRGQGAQVATSVDSGQHWVTNMPHVRQALGLWRHGAMARVKVAQRTPGRGPLNVTSSAKHEPAHGEARNMLVAREEALEVWLLGWHATA